MKVSEAFNFPENSLLDGFPPLFPVVSGLDALCLCTLLRALDFEREKTYN